MTDNALVVDTETLKKVTGYERPSKIEKCLEAQGIRFFGGRNGPWTTVALLNAAKGLATLPSTTSEDIL